MKTSFPRNDKCYKRWTHRRCKLDEIEMERFFLVCGIPWKSKPLASPHVLNVLAAAIEVDFERLGNRYSSVTSRQLVKQQHHM